MNYADRFVPNTINQAIILLFSYLSTTDKKKISKLTEDDLINLNFSLGGFIKNEFKLVTNDSLKESCRMTSGGNFVHMDEASYIIIKAFWKRLRQLQRPSVLN